MKKLILFAILLSALTLALSAQPPPPPGDQPSQGSALVGDLKDLLESGAVKIVAVVLRESLAGDIAIKDVNFDRLPLLTLKGPKVHYGIDLSLAVAYRFTDNNGALVIYLP